MKSNIELNGNFIKKVSSGGDALIGRTHGGLETEFNTHFLPVVLANDMNKIVPYDDAVHGRVRCITYKKEFVAEPTNEFELKMDFDLKEELKTLRFQKVFVGLLLRSHADFIDNDKVEIEPAEVINSKKEWIEQDKTPITTFLKDYNITDDVTDFIKSKEIQDWIDEKKLGISMTKFGMELNKYVVIHKLENVVRKIKKIGGKATQTWIGISPKKDNAVDEGEEEDN
jgi:phage/plasmid-associated DNA primase